MVDYYQPRLRVRPLELVSKLRRADVVFGWFASWHTFAALTLARLMRKPSVLVIGGFDTARMPEISYGAQRGGARRWMTRRTIAMATRLITNSRYSLREIEANLGLGADRVTLSTPGSPTASATAAPVPRERIALSVGIVYRVNLERKGQRPFVEAARVARRRVRARRQVVRRRDRRAARRGRPNVTFTGYLEDPALDRLFSAPPCTSSRPARGVRARGRRGDARPVRPRVVTDAGALPEVVGDTGVVIASPTRNWSPRACGSATRARARGR